MRRAAASVTAPARAVACRSTATASTASSVASARSSRGQARRRMTSAALRAWPSSIRRAAGRGASKACCAPPPSATTFTFMCVADLYSPTLTMCSRRCRSSTTCPPTRCSAPRASPTPPSSLSPLPPPRSSSPRKMATCRGNFSRPPLRPSRQSRSRLLCASRCPLRTSSRSPTCALSRSERRGPVTVCERGNIRRPSNPDRFIVR
mmetsp:Transcript_40283/g.134326  ORF Transcript_40283/g.134326 Transcript_40283/m.134326 type:complete len:206 (-) Transcript_40283:38-655(-)